MLAKSLILALSLAATGLSFTLPEGLPNGAYRAYYNEAREEVHEPVLVNTSAPEVLSTRDYDHSQQSKRATIQTWCGCDKPMNAGDTNIANQGLADQAASYPTVDPGMAYYTIQNTAVAFVCNVDDKTANIPQDVVITGAWDVTAACGLFYAGTSRIQWPEALDYGYMNYFDNLDFCGHAQEAKTGSCCNPGSQTYLSCPDNCCNANCEFLYYDNSTWSVPGGSDGGPGAPPVFYPGWIIYKDGQSVGGGGDCNGYPCTDEKQFELTTQLPSPFYLTAYSDGSGCPDRCDGQYGSQTSLTGSIYKNGLSTECSCRMYFQC